MSDILRDPVWQFIGAILAFVAILTAVGLYLRQRRYKQISYVILSQTPLLSMAEEIKDKLQVLYEGKIVRQVHLIIVKIMNSGKVPIVSADFVHPINLDFGGARILTAEISKTSPHDLEVSISLVDNNVVLNPTLLNEGDAITLKMLVTEFRGQVVVKGRIVGVKEIRAFVARPSRWLRWTFIGLAIQYGGLLGMFLHNLFLDVPYNVMVLIWIVGSAAVLPCVLKFLQHVKSVD